MELELYDFDLFKIYQPKDGYHFSYDPFLLASNFLNQFNCKSIVDFGSGCGIISILVSIASLRLKKYIVIYAIESNIKMLKIIQKNSYLNKLNNIIILQNTSSIPTNSIDCILSNPPYFNKQNYRISNKYYKEKFETESFNKYLYELRRIVVNKGILKLSYHPTRLIEIIKHLNNFNFGIKNITPIYGNKNKQHATVVMLESQFNSTNQTEIKTPIYLDSIDLTEFVKFSVLKP